MNRGQSILIGLMVAWAALLVIATTSSARTMRLTVVDPSSVTIPALNRAEQAVTFQVNHQLRRYWHVPRIAFVPTGGIPVDLFSGARGLVSGVHMWVHARPAIWLLTGTHATRFRVRSSGGRLVSWTVALSHEVLEMLVNPHADHGRKAPHRTNGYRVWVEVCDAVEADTYLLHGVRVSDFVTPRWFRFSNTNFMAYDFLQKVSGPFQIAPGGYVPGQA